MGDSTFLPAPAQPMGMATVVMVAATSSPAASVMAVAATMTTPPTATGRRHWTIVLCCQFFLRILLHLLRFLLCQGELHKNAKKQNGKEQFHHFDGLRRLG
ncbi:unnamed protein product [Schistocephalus solidus]|uniref:Secreted protein n=1 Tax=Schistocephalus solidus TaxID=70667 RepID=A0A183TT98_SCHSO|nr:unnamed protein product [Schistocephalus solidus]